MSFNLPADFTKKMLWGLLPFMTGFMMLSQRANLARSNIAGRYYMRLVLPVMASLHPAYLLRSPAQKRLAFDDLLSVAKRLGAVQSNDETG